jgi:hypothetical protein
MLLLSCLFASGSGRNEVPATAVRYQRYGLGVSGSVDMCCEVADGGLCPPSQLNLSVLSKMK